MKRNTSVFQKKHILFRAGNYNSDSSNLASIVLNTCRLISDFS